MTNTVHQSKAPEVHPSVVPGVRWWPLQYTWWKMQYTQVRLLKNTPVLFMMLDDGLCSTLNDKCSKHQVKLLMYMTAYSVHLLAYTGHHVRLLILHDRICRPLGLNIFYSWWKGRGLHATRALSWKEYLQGNSLTHTVIQQHEHIIKIHNIRPIDDKYSTPKWGSWSAPQCCSWCYSVHLLAYIYRTPCKAPDLHDRICSTLHGKCIHPIEAPEVHPSIVPDVRWWPLQYTWWQIQYNPSEL